MKLNNHGWGLGVFLGFVVIFVLCIVVVSVNAYKLGLEKDGPSIQFGEEEEKPSSTPDSSLSGTEKYQDLIKDAQLAAEAYRIDYYSQLLEGDSVFVPFSTLKEKNYLENTDGCNGYVKILHQGESYQYQTYLKCSDYESDGYVDDLAD